MALDPEQLDRARAGDARAFEALVAPLRHGLTAHCYRMLGSVADADDAVQETLLRAWKGLPGWEGRAALKTWLQRIATNVCLDASERRRRRTLPHLEGPPLLADAQPGAAHGGELAWLEPAPPELWIDQGPEATITARESVQLAFVLAIQRLPASQRAVLLLREVLGWSAQEVAELLETSVPAVNSALQRARAALEQDGVTTRAPPDEAQVRTVLRRYIAAWDTGAPDALAGVLKSDAVLTMPPAPGWYAGVHSITAFRQGLTGMGELRSIPCLASGGPAVAVYVRGPGATSFLPVSIQVLELDGEHVRQVHSFLGPQRFERFGLPARLE